MKLGDMDILKDMLDAQMRIGTLEVLLETCLKKAGIIITPQEVEAARINTFQNMQKRYPNMGLVWDPAT